MARPRPKWGGGERGRTLPNVILRKDWDRLIQGAGSDRDQAILELRDMAILAVFLGTGVRCFELTNANVRNLKWDEEILDVERGKGHKQRLVPVPEWTFEAVEAYLETAWWPGEPDPDAPLFLSRQAKDPPEGELPWNWHPRRLTTRQVQRVVNAAAVRAQVGRCWPHALRHSNATHQVDRAIQDKEPLNDVADNLGHASMDTLRIYVHRATSKRVARNRNL